MSQYVKRTQRDYPQSFKLAVVEQVEKGGRTFCHSGGSMTKSHPLTPEQRIKELEQQLAEAELKADFFGSVVRVSNTEFGVTLTKKQLTTLARKSKRPG